MYNEFLGEQNNIKEPTVWDSFQSSLTNIWDNVSDAASSVYDQSMEVVDENWAAIIRLKNEMKKLFQVRQKVDQEIESLPPGPLRQKLEKKRSQDRGFFDEYIKPAWERFMSLLGIESVTDRIPGAPNTGMGAVSVIAAGAVVAAGAIAVPLTIKAVESYKRNQAILNDPDLKKYKAKLLGKQQEFTLFGDISSSTKYIAYGLGAVALIYSVNLIARFKK